MIPSLGAAEGFRPSTRSGCSLWSRGVPEEWLAKTCDLALGSNQRRFVMDGPRGPAGPQAFVKIVRRRPGHGVVHRLKRSRATLEAEGYLAFGRAGIPIPPLLAIGERRRLGLFELGFVATERVDAPDAAVLAASDPHGAAVMKVAVTLAKIHAAGLVHGDPLLRNFLLCAPPPESEDAGDDLGVLPIDLGGFGAATRDARRRDLIRLLGSVLFHTDDMDQASSALSRYLSRYLSQGFPHPTEGRSDLGDPDRLLAQAVAYRQRKEMKESARADRRAARRLRGEK